MTRIYKDIRDGWTARTEVPLEDDREIHLSTYKDYTGKLVTRAQVGVAKANSFTFVIFQDYHKTLAANKVRCTAKAVTQQHENALSMLPTLIDDVTRFYTNQPALLG